MILKYTQPVARMAATLLVSLLLLTACGGSAERRQEQAMEKAVEQGTGEDAKVDINGENVKIEGENFKANINAGGNTWPADIPPSVPKFSFGTISHTTATKTDETVGWGVFYKGVQPGALEKYDALLKKEGFKTIKTTMDTQGSITGEKDKIIVTLIVSTDMTHLSVQVSR